MKIKNNRIVFTKKDVGKLVEMYWCGHWNQVRIRAIEDDSFYKIKNSHLLVYNLDLDSRTTISNDFSINEIREI